VNDSEAISQELAKLGFDVARQRMSDAAPSKIESGGKVSRRSIA
jgi:hypothetical protein